MNSVEITLLTALLGAIAFVLALAVRRKNVAAAVNAAVSLGVAGVAVAAAAGFEFGQRGFVAPELAFWTAVAGLLHSIGMLGPYDSVWWWDHLTHALSAALLTALVYAGLLVTIDDAVSTVVVAVAAVGYTVVAGICWELGELVARAVGDRYDVEPVLVYYGWQDTAYDLVFDVVGAVLVVAIDVRVFVDLAATAPGTTRQLLVWSSATVVAGSVLMAIALFARPGGQS
ncbi:hypothetical protein [Halobacterium sp. KA-6]|jgi:hypothetical protein|uniref:hypothetical protein n=1 Tax=Halobacterium sp. KA-6 TaxID=2896368 RepID=UPI001E50517C|nr:hypothetical protein [Halobacterium sp. KA-6]MCD2203345.1 hypothetical protein [Halobacterium sp. KA-6]